MAGERVIGFKINIKGSEEVVKTISELEAIVKDTNKALKEAEIGSKEYEELSKQLAGSKERLQEVRKEQRLQIKESEGIRSASGSYRELNAELVIARNRFKELSREDREGDIGKALTLNIQALDKELKDLDTTIGQSQRNVGNYASAFDGLNTVVSGSITDIASLAFGAAGLGALGALLDNTVGSVKALADEFFKLRGEVEQLTGASGEELDTFTSRISAIADTFGVETDEILLSANALTEQLSGDFTESLNAIEAGFLSGANANGELLDSLKEYSVQAAAAGLSTEELLSIINTSTDQGVFSDKGIDTVKEFGLRIREQTKSTRDSLLGAFGEDFTNKLLEGVNTGAISTVEALKTISGEIEKSEIPVARLQTLLADTFGGAGEDAGLPFILSLKDIGSSLDDLSGRNTEYAKQQEAILQLNTKLAEEQNKLSKELSDTSGNFDILILQGKVFFTEVLVSGLSILKDIGAALFEVGKFLSQNTEILTIAATAYAVYNAALIQNKVNLIAARAAEIANATAQKAGAITTGIIAGATAAYNGVLAVLTGSLSLARLAAIAFNFVLSANPIGLIITAVGLFITGLVTLEKRFGGVSKAFKFLSDGFKQFRDGLLKLISGDFTAGIKDIGKVLIKFNPVVIAFNVGRSLFSSLLSGFKKDSDKLGEAAAEAGEKLAEEEKKINEERAKRATANRRSLFTQADQLEKEKTEKERQGEEERIAQREEAAKKALKDAEKRRAEDLKLQKDYNKLILQEEQALNNELDKEILLQVVKDKEAIEARIEARKKEKEEELKAQEKLSRDLDVQDRKAAADREQRAKDLSEALIGSGEFQARQARVRADKEILSREATASETINIEKELSKELLAIQIKTLEEALKLDNLSIEQELALEEQLLAKKRELREADFENEKAERAEQAQFIADTALQTIEIIAQFDEARRNRQITKAEEAAARELELVKGNAAEEERITSALAIKKDKIDQDFRKREQKRAIATALINGALAIVKIIAEVPKGDYGVATVILVALAAAQTVAEIAVISSQKFARGGILNGASHESGGIPVRVGGSRIVEAEGGEAIINRRSTSRFLPLLSSINEAGGGAPLFQHGGLLGNISSPILGNVNSSAESNLLGLISEVRNEVKAANNLALAIRDTQLTQRVILDTQELESVQLTRIELDGLRSL